MASSRYLLLLLTVLFCTHSANAGVLLEFFEHAGFQGKRQLGDVSVPNECNNLPEHFHHKVSSLRWTPTKTVKYTHDDWLFFYEKPGCHGRLYFHVFINESNYYCNLAHYHIDNMISSYQYKKFS
ncbi:hypothetical protein P3T76_012969 [Phytophthora citrophthora]|uniref:Uncharacterized protein n=1 Tax=Phytophthora citrophthora TaxID=4793 RepID=A0AAD9LCR2_9STRA|nr:hypothetical protein P3T76_012969 [Phytophthora citrophthora]